MTSKIEKKEKEDKPKRGHKTDKSPEQLAAEHLASIEQTASRLMFQYDTLSKKIRSRKYPLSQEKIDEITLMANLKHLGFEDSLKPKERQKPAKPSFQFKSE